MTDVPEEATDPVEELLAGCLQHPEGEVDAAVDAACRAHPALASALRRRYSALREMGMVEEAPPQEGTPERLGPFRLLQRLGSGGMGVVYLAEQEPLGRRVALKLIRPENLFFPGAHARFNAEAEVIARLEHPGIVPIYTFGDEQGVPYFAMEFVDGRTLSERIADLTRRDSRPTPADLGQEDRRNWSEACCAVALQVARALQHAHDRGVIHRDVKPSNIMLRRGGHAMLLDFGLASRADGADLTRSGSQPGSVAYMSPEQLRGEEVDPRTDVYSLGVTLYELLSLRAPFLGGSLHDVQERVLRGDPTPLREIDRSIEGDAAVLCAKAMAPERHRRYRTAADLAADLEALLERRPIAARPAGPWLRLRRFVQRRPTLSASLALSFALVVGVPLLLYLQERAARLAIAEKADIANQLSDFMIGLFAETTPDRARGETVPARVALDRGVLLIRTRFAGKPLVKSALLQAMGNAYRSLGLFAEAEPLLVEALSLRERHGRPGVELARCQRDLSELFRWRGSLPDAERYAEKALATMREAGLSDTAEFALMQSQRAASLHDAGRSSEALEQIERCIEVLRRAGPAARASLSLVLGHEIRVLMDLGRAQRAAPLIEEKLALLDALYEGDHPGKVLALEQLGMEQHLTGQAAESARTFEEALRMASAMFDANHPRVAEVLETYAATLTGPENVPHAKKLLDRALEMHRRTYPANHPTLARALLRQSRILFDLGDIRGGRRAVDEAVRIAEKVWPDGHGFLVPLLTQKAWGALQDNRLDVALEAGQRAVLLAERLDIQSGAEHADALRILAMVEATRAPSEEAIARARRALDMVRAWYGKPHFEVALTRCALAYALTSSRQAEAAVPEAKAGLAMMHATVQPPHWGLAWAEYLLGWAQLETGDIEHAIENSRQAADDYARAWPPEHPIHAFPLNNLGVALARSGKTDRAENHLRRALEIRSGLEEDNDLLALSRLNYAAVLNLLGRRAEAETIADRCLDHIRPGSKQIVPCVLLLRRLLARREAGEEDWERLRNRAVELAPDDDRLLRTLERNSKDGAAGKGKAKTKNR